MDKDAKFLNKILGNQMQQDVKRIDTITKWDLFLVRLVQHLKNQVI